MPGPLFARDGDVSLRTVEADDLDFLQRNRNRLDIRQPIASPDPRNGHQWTDIFENGISEDDSYHFLICDESGADDGDVDADQHSDSEPTRVGVVAMPRLQRTDDVGSLLYCCAPDYRENGYVTAGTRLLFDFVFRDRGFHKVFAHVIVPNEPSIAILESLGFEREGRLREEVLYQGSHVDSYRFGLLRHE